MSSSDARVFGSVFSLAFVLGGMVRAVLPR